MASWPTQRSSQLSGTISGSLASGFDVVVRNDSLSEGSNVEVAVGLRRPSGDVRFIGSERIGIAPGQRRTAHISGRSISDPTGDIILVARRGAGAGLLETMPVGSTSGSIEGALPNRLDEVNERIEEARVEDLEAGRVDPANVNPANLPDDVSLDQFRDDGGGLPVGWIAAIGALALGAVWFLGGDS
jgi:hypothetical protein